jgi:hypothetical protein
MKEGPTKKSFTVSRYFCTDCEWLRRTHKKWIEATDCFHPKWDGPFPGRSLGGDEDTPDWCPYLVNAEPEGDSAAS